MARHGAHNPSSKEPIQRQLRVGEELRHALVRVLDRGDIRDPDVAGATITVAEVRVSPDLKNATAFVMTLGGVDVDPVVAGLNRAKAFVRREIAQMIALRYAPAIKFERDNTFDEASKIDALLKDVIPESDQD